MRWWAWMLVVFGCTSTAVADEVLVTSANQQQIQQEVAAAQTLGFTLRQGHRLVQGQLAETFDLVEPDGTTFRTYYAPKAKARMLLEVDEQIAELNRQLTLLQQKRQAVEAIP